MCKKTPVIVFPAAGVPTSGFWKHWFDKLHSAYILLSPLKKEPTRN